MMKPSFSAEINLGHVLQAAVVVASVTMAAVTLRGYYDDRFAGEDQKLALHEMRLTSDEAQLAKMQSEDDNFRTEMRGLGSQLMAAIADLKLQIAMKEDVRKK